MLTSDPWRPPASRQLDTIRTWVADAKLHAVEDARDRSGDIPK